MTDRMNSSKTWTGVSASPLLDIVAQALVRSNQRWFTELGWVDADGRPAIPLIDDITIREPGLGVPSAPHAKVLRESLGRRCIYAHQVAPEHPGTRALQDLMYELTLLPDHADIGLALVITSSNNKGHYAVYVDLRATRLLAAIPIELNLADSPPS